MSNWHLEPGTILDGRYRLLRLLGEGGMGAVYEAENSYTKRRVALKLMHSTTTATDARERLLREAQAASRIQHRNVVDVYDVGFERDALFMVMELLSGETLAARLERELLPIPFFLTLLTQTMRGAAYAHRAGIIHRDVKPENILLAHEPDQEELVPKLLDFGIAKLDDARSITRSGHTIGTPRFMSLEQLRGANDLDARVDVYAFGVILYEALAGRPPYDGRSLPELAYLMTTTQPEPLERLRPSLPAPLCAVVMHALAKERELRTPNLEQLIAQLLPFCSESAWLAQGAALETTARPLSSAHVNRAAAVHASERYEATSTAPAPNEHVSTGPARSLRPPRMRAFQRVARLSSIALPLAAACAALLLSSPNDRESERHVSPQRVHEAALRAPVADRPIGTDRTQSALPPALVDAPSTPVMAPLSTSVASVHDAGSLDHVLASKPTRVPAAHTRVRTQAAAAAAPPTFAPPAPVEPVAASSDAEPIAQLDQLAESEPSELAPSAAPPITEQRTSVQPARATVFRVDQF